MSLALLLIPHNALAWDFGPWFDGFHHWGLFSNNDNYVYGQPGSGYNNGYYAGQQDAIYDHDNNLVYNPYPQCCHSELYRHMFQEGYDQQWNTYQSQEQNTNQHTNIYVNGNNNYINTAQCSNQGQSKSPQCEQCLRSDNINDDCSNGCPWGQGP
jgi:hypothetical protein